MDQWVPAALALVGVLVGIAARGEYTRLTERGRLHRRISAELDMLAKLPEGSTRDALRRHVEAQVRYLVAHEEPPSVSERLAVRWYVTGLLGTFALGGLVVTGEFGGSGPVAWVVGFLVVLALLVQASQLMTALERRNARRWQRLHDAQAPES